MNLLSLHSLFKPVSEIPASMDEVLMVGASLKHPGMPLSQPDQIGVLAICNRVDDGWFDHAGRRFNPIGWIDLDELAAQRQSDPAEKIRQECADACERLDDLGNGTPLARDI